MEEYDRIEIQHICSNICSGETPKKNQKAVQELFHKVLIPIWRLFVFLLQESKTI